MCERLCMDVYTHLSQCKILLDKALYLLTHSFKVIKTNLPLSAFLSLSLSFSLTHTQTLTYKYELVELKTPNKDKTKGLCVYVDPAQTKHPYSPMKTNYKGSPRPCTVYTSTIWLDVLKRPTGSRCGLIWNQRRGILSTPSNWLVILSLYLTSTKHFSTVLCLHICPSSNIRPVYTVLVWSIIMTWTNNSIIILE